MGLAFAARDKAAESAESKALKAQFARQVERIKSLEASYKLDTTSNLRQRNCERFPST